MIYTVFWEPDALSALAAIWLQASDRQGVTAAQAGIDKLLAVDPAGNGIDLSEGLFAVEVPPLRAQFEVSDSARIVRVVSVGWLQ